MGKNKVRCNNCKALMTYNKNKSRWECKLCGNAVNDNEGLEEPFSLEKKNVHEIENVNGRNYY